MRRRFRDHGEGQALVEFAVVIPIVVLLVLALFDAGRAVVFYSELTNASRVGARVAMVNQSNDSTCVPGDATFKCAAADQTTGMAITPADIVDVQVSGSDCALIGSCTATVTIDYSFQPITPIVSSIIGPISLSSSTTMPIERLYASP
jgi:Flp pilus assembly protein TadG